MTRFLLIGFTLLHLLPVMAQQPVDIGVLAYRGADKAVARWQPTIDYLQRRLPRYRFTLVPLNLPQMRQRIEKAQLEFVLTNTGQYVYLENIYGISRIATLINRHLNEESARYGAVIFTRASNNIYSLADLRGKTMGAVEKNGFGGFLMAWREFADQGLDPFSHLREIVFTGFPQQQVLAGVLSGRFDAGTFRTDSLERLAIEGKINLVDLRILAQKHTPGFPFLHSTRLYPEWPFAKLKHTPRDLARKVAMTLLTVDKASDAAIASNSAGWTVPLDYQPVHDMMKSLKVGPYEHLRYTGLAAIIKAYAHWLAIFLLALIISVTTACYVVRLNKRLRRVNSLLQYEIGQNRDLVEKLHYQTLHDELTGLNNRLAFDSNLNNELKRARRNDLLFSVMLIDLDNFKNINDELGHYAGDCLLKEVARRLTEIMRDYDVVARMGGDEFAVLALNLDDLDIANQIAERISGVFQPPFFVADHQIQTKASIGIAMYPLHGNDAVTLYQHADSAMYTAKKANMPYSIYAKNQETVRA